MIVIILTIFFCICFIKCREITQFELIMLIISTILISLLMYGFSFIHFPNDYYFISGKINTIEYHPYFVEEYEQEHIETYACGTDSEGNTEYCERIYYTTEHATHNEYWLAKDTINQENEIDKNFYDIIAKDFGNNLKTYYNGKTTRCNHGGYAIRGDNKLYYYNNETNTYNYPTTRLIHYFNPILGSKSIFNTKTDFKLDYSDRITWLSNSRNKAVSDITDKDLDILNTKLYELIGVNVNIIKLNDITEMNKLEDYWKQGKKNDINICYVGDFRQPEKVKVFGWYKESILKYDLEKLILEKGLQKSTLSDIHNMILKEYKPFDFDNFKYIRNESTTFKIITVVLTLLITGFIYMTCLTNEDRR